MKKIMKRKSIYRAARGSAHRWFSFIQSIQLSWPFDLFFFCVCASRLKRKEFATIAHTDSSKVSIKASNYEWKSIKFALISFLLPLKKKEKKMLEKTQHATQNHKTHVFSSCMNCTLINV